MDTACLHSRPFEALAIAAERRVLGAQRIARSSETSSGTWDTLSPPHPSTRVRPGKCLTCVVGFRSEVPRAILATSCVSSEEETGKLSIRPSRFPKANKKYDIPAP
jgi:hypothetical protein